MAPPSTKGQSKTRVCPWWLAYTFGNPVRRLFHKPISFPP